MKVWIVNHYAVAPTQAGGTRHHTLAREMNSRGHDVTIFASSVDYLTRRESHLCSGEKWKREVVEGVPFVWMRTPPYTGNSIARVWNMLSFSGQLLRYAQTRSAQTPDAIIGSSPHLFAPLVAQALAGRYGIPFVLEVRDLWPQTLVDLGNYSAGHPMIRVFAGIERYLYRKAHRIVSLLPAAVDHMVERGARKDAIVWLPNGIDLSMSPAPGPAAPGGAFKIMYTGAHGNANGLDVILDAASILQRKAAGKEIHFLFVGDGPEKPRLRQLALDRNIGNVFFRDPVPKAQVHSVLQEANALVFTLRKADLFKFGISSNKLFDYMAAGRPVIFGANSLNNPVAEARAGFTIPPETPEAMADAVTRLAGMSPDELHTMGARGRRYVEENHDLRRLAGRLENLLLDLESRSPRSRFQSSAHLG